MAGRLSNELRKAGYVVELPVKDEKTVQRVFVRFAGILQEAGLGRRERQKPEINIEIDADLAATSNPSLRIPGKLSFSRATTFFSFTGVFQNPR